MYTRHTARVDWHCTIVTPAFVSPPCINSDREQLRLVTECLRCLSAVAISFVPFLLDSLQNISLFPSVHLH